MLIKYVGTLAAGIIIGFGGACFLGKTEKRVARKDSVTLERSDLAHVLTAIQLVKDRPAGRSYTRYESNNGRVAFECPTNKACNLEIPAAGRETSPLVEIITEEVRAEAQEPSQAVTPISAPVQAPIDAVSGINKRPAENRPSTNKE